MRAPLDQFWSSYHYFCILGMEGRHMWTEDQKGKGSCDTPLRKWYIPDVCSRFLATGAATQLDLEHAMAALEHPCMWTLDTATLDTDIIRIGQHFPAPWNTASRHLAHANIHNSDRRQRPPLPEATTGSNDTSPLPAEFYYEEMARQIPPSDAAFLLDTRLAPHARCYAAYRSIRERMFARPIEPFATC